MSDADGNTIPAATATSVLEYLVKSVVDNPDEVRVDVDDSASPLVLEVQVGDGDMGRVIGKRGRVAGAIRTVVGAAAAKDDIKVEVEFLD